MWIKFMIFVLRFYLKDIVLRREKDEICDYFKWFLEIII